MEKSNISDTFEKPILPQDDPAVMGRKLVLAKQLFIWVATGYYLVALMASGGFFVEVTIPLAKAGKIALFFGVAILAHTLITNKLYQAGGTYAKLRPLSLGIVSILFILSVAANFFH